MRREEMIKMAKNASTAKELTEILRRNGMGGIAEDSVEKLFNVLHSSKELSDDELDVSAGAELGAATGGCFIFKDTICPNCQNVGNFSVIVAFNPENGTSTLHCNNCGKDVSVPL